MIFQSAKIPSIVRVHKSENGGYVAASMYFCGAAPTKLGAYRMWQWAMFNYALMTAIGYNTHYRVAEAIW